MSKAILIDGYGGAEVMRVADVDAPHAGPGQVRLRVMTAGVNPIDFKIRNGWMQAMFPTSFPYVPGSDVTGVIDEIGEGVPGYEVGDEVVGSAATGSFAEFAVAAAEHIHLKPSSLGWTEAAAYPAAAEAAYRCLVQLDVGEGDLLLIHGASGAVGLAASQLAVNRGADVIGTAGPSAFDFLRSIGVTPVQYGDGVADRVRQLSPRGVDAVLDAAGRDVLAESVDLAGGADRVITIADPRAVEFGVRFSGGGPTDRMFEGIGVALELFEKGEFDLPIAATYPLDDAATALDDSEHGHALGKLVLIVSQ